MRRKTLIPGFRNGQRFRYILRQPGTDFEVGMYITIQQMSDNFATVQARHAVEDMMTRLGYERMLARKSGQEMPRGVLGDTAYGFHCQVDLCD